MKRECITTNDIVPGDLVFSPRTHQLMLILSIARDGDRAHVTWIPLKDKKPVMSIDISGLSKFFKLSR